MARVGTVAVTEAGKPEVVDSAAGSIDLEAISFRTCLLYSANELMVTRGLTQCFLRAPPILCIPARQR
jgi:hypothetical protein